MRFIWSYCLFAGYGYQPNNDNQFKFNNNKNNDDNDDDDDDDDDDVKNIKIKRKNVEINKPSTSTFDYIKLDSHMNEYKRSLYGFNKRRALPSHVDYVAEEIEDKSKCNILKGNLGLHEIFLLNAGRDLDWRPKIDRYYRRVMKGSKVRVEIRGALAPFVNIKCLRDSFSDLIKNKLREIILEKCDVFPAVLFENEKKLFYFPIDEKIDNDSSSDHNLGNNGKGGTCNCNVDCINGIERKIRVSSKRGRFISKKIIECNDKINFEAGTSNGNLNNEKKFDDNKLKLKNLKRKLSKISRDSDDNEENIEGVGKSEGDCDDDDDDDDDDNDNINENDEGDAGGDGVDDNESDNDEGEAGSEDEGDGVDDNDNNEGDAVSEGADDNESDNNNDEDNDGRCNDNVEGKDDGNNDGDGAEGDDEDDEDKNYKKFNKINESKLKGVAYYRDLKKKRRSRNP